MGDLTVSKLAVQAHVASDTIRFYEKEGLIPEPDRSPSGYRLYDLDTVARVRFTKDGHAMGLKLTAIKQLLELLDQGRCPCGHTTELLDDRIHELDEEIARFKRMGAELLRMKESSSNGTYQWRCPSRKEGEV